MSERLKQYVHDLRQIGNFSVHEQTQATGEVIDVEEVEAEWLLELLLVAFDFYYVTPARDAGATCDAAEEARESLSQAGKEAGQRSATRVLRRIVIAKIGPS